jgi:acetoacetyl-CoA reductase
VRGTPEPQRINLLKGTASMARIVVVTNGMNAVGEAICMRFFALGYQVATTYSPDGGPHAWLAGMGRLGYRFSAYPCALSEHSSARQCLARIEKEIGPVDILVNHAGSPRSIMHGKTLNEQSGESGAQTDRDPACAMTKSVCDGMTARGWGRIIHIAPADTEKGACGQTLDAAAAGVCGFTKAQLLDAARKGVTVNTVSFGIADAALPTAVSGQTCNTANIPQIPVGRLSLPEEVAGLVAYLASEEAAFLTGTHMAIKGPQHSE